MGFIVGMEVMAAILLIGFLIVTWKDHAVPLVRSISTISETDEVADIQPQTYGAATQGLTANTVTRSRKFSESIKGSYMASSLARSMARPGMIGGLGAPSLRRGGGEGDPLLA